MDPSSPVEENVIALFTSHEKNKNVIEKVGAGTNLESWKGEPKFRKDFMGVSSQAEEIVLTQDMVVSSQKSSLLSLVVFVIDKTDFCLIDALGNGRIRSWSHRFQNSFRQSSFTSSITSRQTLVSSLKILFRTLY